MTEIRRLPGLQPYGPVWEAMQQFSEARDADTPNQIWQVEHFPVYTLGQAGKPEHILNPGNIPVVKSNRGGQVTYHGPGQVVVYPLIDLRRAGIYVKEYVVAIEDAIIETLAEFGIPNACRKPGAPGVYVPMQNVLDNLAKIAALGVKVVRGCTYHGLAINVDMDLNPYSGINPCGYAGMRTIDMKTLGISADWQAVADAVSARLAKRFP